MKNWKAKPEHSLISRFIDCYWFLEKEPKDTGNNHPKLNPDPAAHFILSDEAQPFHYSQSDTYFAGNGSHWIYPHSKTFLMDHSSPFSILGIKFKPGALYSLPCLLPLSGDTKSLIDTVASTHTNTLLNTNTETTGDWLFNAGLDSQKTCNSLDELLLPLVTGLHEDKHSKLVHTALPLLDKTPIATISQNLQCSHRTLERSFQRVTGFTLKQYQSMQRLEAILMYLHTLDAEQIHWADVANRFEFSDQPHLIRHLKQVVGVTPGEYAKVRDLTIDIYGNFE